MKRRPPNLLTALSLLLCAAVVALWVRSYFVTDAIECVRHTKRPHSGRQSVQLDFSIGRGRIVVDWTRADDWPEVAPESADTDPPAASGRRAWAWRRTEPHDYSLVIPNVPGRIDQAGFGYYHVAAQDYRSVLVAVPAWAPVALLLLLPITRLLRWLRRRRPLGLCPDCGYDLRATPTQCPECGHPVRSPPGTRG